MVDADSCFDRIAHPIASLIFQALGVNSQALEAMLTTIQEMKFFLRTDYGDFKKLLTPKSNLKLRDYVKEVALLAQGGQQ